MSYDYENLSLFETIQRPFWEQLALKRQRCEVKIDLQTSGTGFYAPYVPQYYIEQPIVSWLEENDMLYKNMQMMEIYYIPKIKVDLRIWLSDIDFTMFMLKWG